MTQENQDYLSGLEKIVDMHDVDRISKDYLKYKAGSLKRNPDGSEITDSQYILPLGRKISPNNDPNMFLNETQAAIENEVGNYKQTRKTEVEDAASKYKDQIISDYSKGINHVLEESKKNIKSQLEEKLQKLPAEARNKISEEEKKKLLEIELYKLLGGLVKDLDLSEDYKANKDLVEAVQGLKELEETDESERKDIVADRITKEDRLTSNYRNFRRDWNGLYDQMRMNYSRVIGKQLLKENNGNYSINEELLKEAYSNVDSLKKMSPVAKAYQEANKKAA